MPTIQTMFYKAMTDLILLALLVSSGCSLPLPLALPFSSSSHRDSLQPLGLWRGLPLPRQLLFLSTLHLPNDHYLLDISK